MDRTQQFILIGLALTLLAIVLLASFASWLHRRTRRQLSDQHDETHDRLSRRDHDHLGVLMQMTTALVEFRRDLVSWWREKR